MDVGEKKVFVKKIQNTVFGTIYLDVGEKKVSMLFCYLISYGI